MRNRWQSPTHFLLLMSFAMPLAYATWSALLNNFAIERAAFTGIEIGSLQSIREIPGFLAFTAVFLLLLIREQPFALLALGLTGLGVAVTGLFPTVLGLYVTTFIMSMGFHYLETIKQSLTLQWLPKAETPQLMGRMISAAAVASLCVYAGLWLLTTYIQLDYRWLYLIGGGLCIVLVVLMWRCFPTFASPTIQNKKLLLRKRYWLYYALTFMSGARRQIFVVFAGFMMVEKFHYSVPDIAALYLVNHLFNWFFAAKIGRWIGSVGERLALCFEYSGLILVFVGYALVENAQLAAGLYIVDHLFFALAIGISTYFQKIADPADIASSAGVSFTINHIAAVVIPIAFGFIWLISPAWVFYAGAAMAVLSLILAFNIPNNPNAGNEVRYAPALLAGASAR